MPASWLCCAGSRAHPYRRRTSCLPRSIPVAWVVNRRCPRSPTRCGPSPRQDGYRRRHREPRLNVHLVDGTYELFRAPFGAPPQTSPAGSEVGATLGLMRSLVSLLGEDGVTHVGCAFDLFIESFRNELYPGYKTSEGVPEELLAQFPRAERATRALGVVVWPMVEFEADDALATAAAQAGALDAVTRVVICSPDKDLAQCVRGSRVVC